MLPSLPKLRHPMLKFEHKHSQSFIGYIDGIAKGWSPRPVENRSMLEAKILRKKKLKIYSFSVHTFDQFGYQVKLPWRGVIVSCIQKFKPK